MLSSWRGVFFFFVLPHVCACVCVFNVSSGRREEIMKKRMFFRDQSFGSRVESSNGTC